MTKNRTYLQTGPTLRIQISNMRLLRIRIPSEGWWERHLSPVLGTDEVCGLVQLRSQVQEIDAFIRHHDRVDFHVGEVEVHIDPVEG